MADMRKSLALLAKLPPETEVIPGHGSSTTIAREVAFNPFIER
jgi:glyoxylase-like metal-dependent hydrolase (beta-lactamase superfamily II)